MPLSDKQKEGLRSFLCYIDKAISSQVSLEEKEILYRMLVDYSVRNDDFEVKILSTFSSNSEKFRKIKDIIQNIIIFRQALTEEGGNAAQTREIVSDYVLNDPALKEMEAKRAKKLVEAKQQSQQQESVLEKIERETAERIRSVEINRIEMYLNNISNLAASFTQQGPNGESSSGTLYVIRPGKLCWKYDQPDSASIIINNSQNAQCYDKQNNKTGEKSLDDVLGSFLVQPKISIDGKGLNVKSVKKENGRVRIEVVKAGSEAKGSFTLISNDATSHLAGIEVVDSQNKKTIISFTRFEINSKLDPSIFDPAS